jgi:hypothetical protein
MGIKTAGKYYPSIHLAYMWLTWKLTNLSKDTLTPAPNPDFVHLLNNFFWLHLAYTVSYFISKLKLMKEILLYINLLSSVCQVYLFINACVAHFKYNREMGYSDLQVEDTVHFLVLIEIATYATSLLVLMMFFLLVSFRNEWQVRRVQPINNVNEDGFAMQPA